MLCTTPIVNTDGSGIPSGKLVFIQEAEAWIFPRLKVERLTTKQLKFEAPPGYNRDPSIFGLDGSLTILGDSDDAESNVVIKTLDDKFMTVWAKFEGVSNKTLRDGFNYYMIIQLLSIIVVAIGIYLILKVLIFNRLEGFYTLIKTIDGDLNVPLAEIAGKDELERMTSFTVHALTETKIQKGELKRQHNGSYDWPIQSKIL